MSATFRATGAELSPGERIWNRTRATSADVASMTELWRVSLIVEVAALSVTATVPVTVVAGLQTTARSFPVPSQVTAGRRVVAPPRLSCRLSNATSMTKSSTFLASPAVFAASTCTTTSRKRPSTTFNVLAEEIHAMSSAARVGLATVGDRIFKETPSVPRTGPIAGEANSVPLFAEVAGVTAIRKSRPGSALVDRFSPAREAMVPEKLIGWFDAVFLSGRT